jgi:hypothetical protein
LESFEVVVKSFYVSLKRPEVVEKSLVAAETALQNDRIVGFWLINSSYM